ncbi:3-hydroxybenzoate 6-monooxygenase [Variovorax sp. J22G21]|uniref:3-hydroxybenzoate 6-monooxygenase n=1 Tax=Variovorax fucosicus TaxID=3053517 RepID=UPI00257861BA|nr:MULTISPECIES: 3-hydroxybenzoate 6-monooxygenase [unclassified Variovorax]MDM0042656.1 3-hydroxybenzoate 6-monooxygenase [Variovorax sp. J22R193]MDM0061261.1 3-hydroxybenzoate 6-monooxygenase [Variovorax sp. J22G21]
MSAVQDKRPVLVAGGGIGGLAAALALVREGYNVKVIEQSAQIGEIGAGIQLSPNAFAACDALGVGANLRAKAVYTEEMVMFDAIDAKRVASISLGDGFRERFGNPYAVIHRADIHGALFEGVQATTEGIEFLTSTKIVHVEQDDNGVTLTDAKGGQHEGQAVIGCDGVRSAVRQQYVGDSIRVSGHVVFRAVIDTTEFPEALRFTAPCIWVGPNCHLVHYPLKGGDKFNLAVTFHSDHAEEWGSMDGDPAEVQRYFRATCEQVQQILRIPKAWKRWSTADRDPIEQWTFGRATLLGDAAHPMVQYLAQGACTACEDAVTLARALRHEGGDWPRALALYEKSRVARTARVVLSAREMGRIYHAKGVERLVRNDMWKGREQERFYDALDWLYGWTAEKCLALD